MIRLAQIRKVLIITAYLDQIREAFSEGADYALEKEFNNYGEYLAEAEKGARLEETQPGNVKKRKLAADRFSGENKIMEVLSSGSFINLDNQEKIERLIFTAGEIAVAASETYGFSNEEENNKKFALEIWQGAEYMCRSTEEARIKNIFTNAFLERLQELRGEGSGRAKSPVEVSQKVSQEFAPEQVEETAASKDEFLGFVSTEDVGENSDTHEQSSLQEDTAQMPAAGEEFFQPENNFEQNRTDEAGEPAVVEPNNVFMIPPKDAEYSEAEIEKVDEAAQEKAAADEIPQAIGATRFGFTIKSPINLINARSR
jgi:hypothetical protein